MLARQHLLTRATTDIVTVVRDVCGLQTQYAPTAYVGLWSRLDGFQRADLTAALEQRSVVQATLVRNTIHVVAATDYWPHRLAVGDVMRRWFLRLPGHPTERTMRAAADRVHKALAGGGEVTRKELDRLASPARGSDVGMWVDLVRAPPSGTWERRRADRYALAEEWIGTASELSVDEARDHLVRCYLTGFGPASVKEIASFCSMNVGDIRGAAERVAARRFRAEDGTDLLDLDGLPLPDENAPAPARFLGTWEAILLAHARRALVIREEDRARIFATRIPQSLPTFLVDGQVAGTWKYVNGTVEVDHWRELSSRQRRELDDEAGALGNFHR